MWRRLVTEQEAVAIFPFRRSADPAARAFQRELSVGEHIIVTHEAAEAGWCYATGGMFPRSYVEYIEHEHGTDHAGHGEHGEDNTQVVADLAPLTGSCRHDHTQLLGYTSRMLKLRRASAVVAEATEAIIEWIQHMRHLLEKGMLDEYEHLRKAAFQVMRLRQQIFDLHESEERATLSQNLWQKMDKTYAHYNLKQSVRFADGTLANLDTTGASDLLYALQALSNDSTSDVGKPNDRGDGRRRGSVSGPDESPSFPASPNLEPKKISGSRTMTVKNILGFRRSAEKESRQRHGSGDAVTGNLLNPGGDNDKSSFAKVSSSNSPRSMTMRFLRKRHGGSDPSEAISSPEQKISALAALAAGDSNHTPLDLRGMRRNLSAMSMMDAAGAGSNRYKPLPTDSVRSVGFVALRHLLVNISAFHVDAEKLPQSLELHFSLFLQESKRFVTDSFFLQYENGEFIGTKPEASTEGSKGKSSLEPRCILFRDVEISDIEDGVVLVCRVVRRMSSGKDDGLHSPRQLFAVAVQKIEESDWKHRVQKIAGDVKRRKTKKSSKKLRHNAFADTLTIPNMTFISFADEQTAPDSLLSGIIEALDGSYAPTISTTDAIRLELGMDILRGDADDMMSSARSLAKAGLQISKLMKKSTEDSIPRLSLSAVKSARDSFSASAQTLVLMARLAVTEVTRLIYFRSIASLNDNRNDLYVTVVGSSLETDKKRIEVAMEVLREDGKNIADFSPDCLKHGTGQGLKVFTTAVLPRQSSPQWNEMAKVVIPPDLANNAYLVFTLRTVGEGSKATVRSEPRAFAFLKLTESDGGVVASTRHTLTWYKMPDKKTLAQTRTVLEGEDKDKDKDKDESGPARIVAYFLATDRQPWQKDVAQTLTISLRLTSTKMSHTAPIVALMAFRQHSKAELLEAMKNLRSVEASEHKKFAFPLLNALFDMLDMFHDDLQFSDMVFETAILLVCSVSDAEQYGSALREYIFQLSNTKLHVNLLQLIERHLDLRNATSSPTLVKRTLQALPILLKLMIRSYKAYMEESLMSGGSEDAETFRVAFADMVGAVQKSIVGVFTGMQTLTGTAGIRAVLLQIAPFVFFETLENIEDKAVVRHSLLAFFAGCPPVSADRTAILADAVGSIEKLTFAETMLRTLTRQSYQHRTDPSITQDLQSVADQFVHHVIEFTAHALGIQADKSDDSVKQPQPKEAVVQAAVSALGAVLDHIQASESAKQQQNSNDAVSALAVVIINFANILLDPKRIKSKKEATVAGLALARMMHADDPHFRAFLDRFYDTDELRHMWLEQQVKMCLSLLETASFPDHWHELSLYCLESVANHTRTLVWLITEAEKTEPATTRASLIPDLLELVRSLMSAQLLDLRGTSRSHRAVLLAHGDLRQRIFVHVVVPLWERLSPEVVQTSQTQEWFITLMVRLFVGRIRDALVHRLSIRCFFENLRVAIRQAIAAEDTMLGRAKIATTEVLEALAAEGFLTPELYEKHLSLTEYEEFNQNAEPPVSDRERALAAEFFASVADQTGLLFELAKMPEEDDNLGMHDRRIDVMGQILRHMKEHGRARNYVQYVHKLAGLHHSNGDYAEEAMVLLRAHAMTLPWTSSSSDLIDSTPAESASALRARVAALKTAAQSEGRVELFDRVIILLNRAQMSDLALPLVQDLQEYFRKTAPDFKRVISLLQEEARLMQSMIDTERFEPVYFRVSLFGGGFAKFDKSLPNSTWVLRCSRLERRGDVVARLCDKYPGASILQTSTISDDIRESDTAMAMLVVSVLAVDCQELIFLREQMQRKSIACPVEMRDAIASRLMAILNSDFHPGLVNSSPGEDARLPPIDVLKKAQQARERDPQFVRVMRKHCNANVFVYQRPFRKDSEKKSNEFEDLWQANEYCISEEPLPGTRQWARVTRDISIELAPIENAINALMSKNAELDDKVAHFKVVALKRQRGQNSESDPDSLIGPLTMLLNGVIDAAVNGGVALYQKVFFDDAFLVKNPHFEPAVRRLQREVVAHVYKTELALHLHAQLCPVSMIAMQRKLEQFFKNIQSDLLEPVQAQLRAVEGEAASSN